MNGRMSFGPEQFLVPMGTRLTDATTDPRETTFLFQHLSVAVQRFNAACAWQTRSQFQSLHLYEIEYTGL